MGISEAKKQIVIDNYFKNACDVNTSIKEAFTKGFEVGLTKAVFPKDQYEARLKADMVAALDKIKAEIEERKEKEYLCFDDDGMDIYMTGLNDAIGIIDKYKTKPEDI